MKAWKIIFAFALLGATWLLRSPGLDKKIWNVDEAVTFTMAEQILAGDIPYRDAVDQRTPLAPYAQAAVAAVGGHWNLRAQHGALALMIGLSAVLLWQLARRLGDEATGVAAALWFTWLALMLPSVRDTMAAHTAWYLILGSTAGFWALARAWKSGRPGWAVASGAAFGLSFLAKQPGLLDFGVALVLVALRVRAEPKRWRESARLGMALLAGWAAPVLGTGLYFAAKGAWPDVAYYTWTYNQVLYVPEVGRLERWRMMRVPFELAWASHPLVLVAGGLAAVTLLGGAMRQLFRRPAEFDLATWLILGWSAAGLVSTTLSGRDFTHYSIQLIPGLSLACGWLTARLGRAGRDWCAGQPVRRVGMWVAVAALAGWLLWPVAARLRAFNLPLAESDAIAQLVRRHTTPADRIFVWGYTPEIYPLSERRPATRFLYNTFVTGMIPWTNLDPLKNTDYAVVPGAREKFLADWRAHPPALIVDGRTQRGFMKYPLEKQTWLWPLIEAGYAEVATDRATPLGFWLFRRLDAVQPAPLPAGLPISGDLQLRLLRATAGETARVSVHAPGEAHTLELYLDDILYRRLPCTPGAAVEASFFIPAADWSGPGRRLRAVVRGSGDTGRMSHELALVAAAPAAVIGGPPLEFAGRPIAALASSTITGGPILLKQEEPTHWDAHAPSRVVYPWLPGMNSLAFAFGIEAAALAREPPNHTDGVEVVVQTEDQAGHITQVYRYHFDRELARRAGGEAIGFAALPPGGPGRLILQMTPGPDFAPAFDWSYWLWISADRSPLSLLVDRQLRPATRIDAPGGLRQASVNGRSLTLVATPATIEFAATLEMDELSAGFGLPDTSWLGQASAAPVDFAITQVAPDGRETALFTRTLDPARSPADRGPQSCQVKLPPSLSGRLRFSTRGGPGADAYWTGLRATVLRLALRMGPESIPASPASEGRFGFVNSVEEGRPCLIAHAPASLVYEWREGMKHLTGEYGLISGAYTQHGTDGVVFVVEVQAANGPAREIFRRHLAPTTVPADRGAQALSVEIPAVPGGRLILRTLPAPSGSLNAAWSYWRDLQTGP